MATKNRLRVRETLGEAEKYTLVWRLADGTIDMVGSGGNIRAFHRKESFADQYDAPRNGGVWIDHACNHIRVSGGAYHVGTWFLDPHTVGYEPDRKWLTSYEEVSSQVPGIPSWLLDNLAYSALQTFTTDIEQEGSLLNFVYELKDFEGLLSFFYGLFSRLRTLAASLLQLLIEWGAKPGLTWEFAIKPFIEDLIKFAGLYYKVKRKIEFLKKSNGKVVTLNYNRKDVQELWSWTPEEPSILDNFPGVPHTLPYCVELKQTFRAHAKVKINCKYLDRADRQLDAIAKALGIASIFQWIHAGFDAIPFSWLFSFLFRMNRFWDLMKTSTFADPGYSPLEVITSSHSIKIEAKVLLFGKKPNQLSEEAGSYQFKSYYRGPGLPFSGEGGFFNIHSISQNASMLAILFQIIFPGIRWGRILGRG